MNVLYEAIASLHRQVDERITDDATTPCLLSFDRARAVLDALLAYTAQSEDAPKEGEQMKNNAAMEDHWSNNPRFKEALAEQPAQQEPVAIALNTGTKQGVKWLKNVEHGERLYTSPPASKPWVGLTDEEAEDVWNRYCDEMGEASINDALDIASAIEAKLREKNA